MAVAADRQYVFYRLDPLDDQVRGCPGNSCRYATLYWLAGARRTPDSIRHSTSWFHLTRDRQDLSQEFVDEVVSNYGRHHLFLQSQQIKNPLEKVKEGLGRLLRKQQELQSREGCLQRIRIIFQRCLLGSIPDQVDRMLNRMITPLAAALQRAPRVEIDRSLPIEELVLQMLASDLVVFDVMAEEFGLCKAKWNPSMSFEALMDTLKSKGPMVVGGPFGEAHHPTPPSAQLIGGIQAWGWSETPATQHQPTIGFHLVIVVGGLTHEGQNYLLYRDPNEEERVYFVSYDVLAGSVSATDSMNSIRDDAFHLTANFGYQDPTWQPAKL